MNSVAVTASGRVSGDPDKQFTVAGGTGAHGGGGDAERDGSDDAVEHAGRGGQRGREQWESAVDASRGTLLRALWQAR